MPANGACMFALATDDVMVFSDKGPEGTTPVVAEFERQMKFTGVVKHPKKDVNDATTAVCVGVELVDGVWWWPPLGRPWTLINGGRHLGASRTAFPAAVSGIC